MSTSAVRPTGRPSAARASSRGPAASLTSASRTCARSGHQSGEGERGEVEGPAPTTGGGLALGRREEHEHRATLRTVRDALDMAARG